MGPYGQGYELVFAGVLIAAPFVIGGLLISRFLFKTAKTEISNITTPTNKITIPEKLTPKTSKIISAMSLILSGTGLVLIWEFAQKDGQSYYRYLGNPYLLVQTGVVLVVLGIALSLISRFIARK